MKPLYKTTIVIWSEEDPSDMDLEWLGRQAMSGDAYCSKQRSTMVENPEKDPDWDGTEFFGVDDDEDKE